MGKDASWEGYGLGIWTCWRVILLDGEYVEGVEVGRDIG